MDRVSKSPCISPLAAIDVVGGVAPDESGDHVALALATVTTVSGRTLRNVKIVDQASGDVVDEA